MTREEKEFAIEELQGCIIAEEHGKDGKPNGNVTCELTKDTIDIAIKALEQESTQNPIIDWNNCHTSEQLDNIATTKNYLAVDAVSREAVNELVSSQRLDTFCDEGRKWANIKIDVILRGLKELPSVTLQAPTTKNDLGVDCIDRKALLNRLNDFNEWCKDGRLKGSMFAVDVIKDMPSVTPQEPRIDFEELKRKILVEIDGSTDDAWLAYGEVCNRISNSIDEFVADMRGGGE